MSRREVKISAVEWAISALPAVDAVDNEERKAKGVYSIDFLGLDLSVI